MRPKESFILCGRCGNAVTVPETGDAKPWLVAHDKVCKLAETAVAVSSSPVEKVKTKRLKKKVEPAPEPEPSTPAEESIETKRVRKALEFTAQVLGSFKPRP